MRPLPGSFSVGLTAISITKTQSALTMNCVNDAMKFIHLTTPSFQFIVSLKRVVWLESIQFPLNGRPIKLTTR
jgi:hypothetical protein